MMRKDDPAFQKAVDDSIKAMVKSGQLAKMLRQMVRAADPAPSNTKVGLPLSDATKRRGKPEHQADGRVRDALTRTGAIALITPLIAGQSAAPDHPTSRFFVSAVSPGGGDERGERHSMSRSTTSGRGAEG
jgi:hypothetical protein